MACYSSDPGFEFRWSGKLFNRNWDFIVHSLSLSPTHCSDTFEILLKGRKIVCPKSIHHLLHQYDKIIVPTRGTQFQNDAV